MVGAAGFEPATSCSQGRRANQAALRPERRRDTSMVRSRPAPALSCQSRHASQEPVKPTGTYDGLGFISCTSRAKACKMSSRRHFVARLPAQSAPHWWQEHPSTRHAIRTDMLTRHEKRETKWRVVAGGGLEPPDLQGMNLASYQLLHPANKKYSTMWTKKRGASRRLHKADIKRTRRREQQRVK